FLLAGLYIGYTLIRSFLNPALGPPVPKEERAESMVQVVREVIVGMVPLALLIACTLGTILAGIVTPTEAAAMGGTGAILMSIVYRRFTLQRLKTAVFNTMTTSSMVLFLAVASNVFGAIFARLGSASVITNALTGLPVPPFVTLLLVMGLIFLLGWPFEWPAIIFVFLPIFYPVVAALKYDMLWFGVITAVNLQTAYLSPPVAMSAYYLKQVVPQWSLSTIYRGMADFMVIQVICVVLVLVFPAIAMWFPNWLQERRNAARSAQVERPAPLSALLEVRGVKLAP
ncbi:MAG: TRAP transporter large permease subunit, partial [Gemmatimonadales bacterium]